MVTLASSKRTARSVIDTACAMLFVHANASVDLLQKEIRIRRDIAMTVRIQFLSLSEANAEALIANAIMSIEYATDELRDSELSLRQQLAIEAKLWDELMRHFITLPGRIHLKDSRVITELLDNIIASTKRQDALLKPDRFLNPITRAA